MAFSYCKMTNPENATILAFGGNEPRIVSRVEFFFHEDGSPKSRDACGTRARNSQKSTTTAGRGADGTQEAGVFFI